MATRTRRSKNAPPPITANLLLIPGLLLVAALVALIAGLGGVAAGLLLAGLGMGLVSVGKHRRWKGAPEAGWLLVGVGVIIALVALL